MVGTGSGWCKANVTDWVALVLPPLEGSGGPQNKSWRPFPPSQEVRPPFWWWVAERRRQASWTTGDILYLLCNPGRSPFGAAERRWKMPGGLNPAEVTDIMGGSLPFSNVHLCTGRRRVSTCDIMHQDPPLSAPSLTGKDKTLNMRKCYRVRLDNVLSRGTMSS